MQPWKILSSSVSVGVLTEGWNLAEPSPGAEEERVFQVTVFFATPFDAPPVVHLGLTGFDIDQRDSDRLKIRAAEINAYRTAARNQDREVPGPRPNCNDLTILREGSAYFVSATL